MSSVSLLGGNFSIKSISRRNIYRSFWDTILAFLCSVKDEGQSYWPQRSHVSAVRTRRTLRTNVLKSEKFRRSVSEVFKLELASGLGRRRPVGIPRWICLKITRGNTKNKTVIFPKSCFEILFLNKRFQNFQYLQREVIVKLIFSFIEVENELVQGHPK